MAGKGIKLSKGQGISLNKGSDNLKKIRLELTWNAPNVKNFDADASAFVCDADDRLLSNDHLVFYNNEVSPDKAVRSSGDVRDSGGDGEVITVDLEQLNPRASIINFVITIHNYERRKQNFGQVTEGGVTVFDDETDEELASFHFGKGEYTTETALHIASLYRKGKDWDFEAFGEGQTNVGLLELIEKFGGDLD